MEKIEDAAEKTVRVITPNEKQMECIKTLEGPIMVLAGPGTGKTFTIIQRIKYMIEQGIQPESILCLAFSDPAAAEMKIRLVKEVGATASAVEISTYHAFCNNIISQFPIKFELVENFTIIDDMSKYTLMKSIVEEYKPKYLLASDYNPYFYINHLLKAVAEVKLNRCNKEKYFDVLKNGKEWGKEMDWLLEHEAEQIELAKLGKRNHIARTQKDIAKLEKNINMATEAWDIIEIYMQKMQENNLIDFNDMINFVLDTFDEDPSFAESIRKKYKYLLIDEYQDTNKSQNELIFQLAGDEESPNILVVGDDDQIIYQFQGAQTDNLEKFIQKYKNPKIICLEENNRSSQVILDLSREILKQTPARLENNPKFKDFGISKVLTAKNKDVIDKTQITELHSFAETSQEINFIIDKIKSIIKENPELPLNEIAIIARTNPELKNLADILKTNGIPFQISKKKDIFSLKPSLLVYLYLKALDNHQLYAAGLFGMLNHPPFSFNVDDYTFLVKNCKQVVETKNGERIEHKNFISVIKDNLHSHTWVNKEKVEKFVATFDEIKELQANEDIYNIIIHILNKTNILKYYAEIPENLFENVASIKKITDEAKKFQQKNPSAGLTEFLNYLEMSIKQGIPLSIGDDDVIKNAVQLVTAHKSKGREFSYVFLYNLISTNWEKMKPSEKLKIPVEKATFSDDEEEAKDAETGRLLFVSITRAKYALYMTHSILHNGKNKELSKFIAHIADNKQLIKKVVYELTPEELAKEYINKFLLPSIYTCDSYLEELKGRVKKHVMSATSFNNYNECPRKFLYTHIYRVPSFEYTNPAKAFGTAVHESFERFTKVAIETKTYPSKDDLVSYFLSSLGEMPLETPEERSNHMVRGKNVLDTYYERFISIPIEKVLSAEKSFNDLSIGDFLIKGKIDRIEKCENGVAVIDYKTGTVKSRASIEDGDNSKLLDQLRFYKLIYEMQYPEQKVEKGLLIFVEEPKTQEFELLDEDKTLIRDKIIATFEKIHNLEFDACDMHKQQAKGCRFCDYKILCTLNSV